MDQDKLEFELSDNICEAVNCSSKVTTTILVKAGDRNITLNICNSCISKFEDTTAEQCSRIIRSEKRGRGK